MADFKVPLRLSSRLLEDLPLDDHTLTRLRRALDGAAGIAAEVVAHRDETFKNPDLSDAAMARRISEFGTTSLTQADALLGDALDKLSRSIEKAETELERSVPLEEGSHSVEIRGHVKGIDQRSRRGFVLAAHETNDVATVAAVLAAPGFLSGLSDDDLAVIRQRRSQTAAKANPKLHRRLESLRTAHRRIEWVRASLDKARVRSFGGALSAQQAA